MTEPRSLHRMPGASPTPSASSNHSFDDLISDITSALTHIMALSEEFTHQSAEMLSALDTLPPELTRISHQGGRHGIRIHGKGI